jgi:hypothetical protein
MPIILPKIAWTWFVVIGSLVTYAVWYAGSLLFPGSRLTRGKKEIKENDRSKPLAREPVKGTAEDAIES